MSLPVQQHGIPAAPGYPQFANTFLMPPMFSDKMLVRFYEESIFSQISTTDYFGDMVGYGDTVYFHKEPCITIRDYAKDQILVHDVPEFTTCKVRIGLAKYFSIKIDKLDEMMIKNWDMLRDKLMENAARSFSQRIDCEMLAQLYTDAHCANRGANAGIVTQSYNLGTPGSPILLDETNILQFLVNMAAVLDEQSIPLANRYMVVPPQFMTKLKLSEVKAAQFLSASGTSPLTTGAPMESLLGFKFIPTNCAPWVMDSVTNTRAWYVIAGLPMATGFVSLAELSRSITDKDSMGNFLQAVLAYGFAVLYPQALAVGYVRF